MSTSDAVERTGQAGDEQGGDTSGSHAPEHEPAAAILRDDEPGPGPSAPEDPAPDLAEINSGEGPGMSPGE